jgi:HK97 family phage major capsid protein
VVKLESGNAYFHIVKQRRANMNRLDEIKARKEELRKLLGGTEQVDLDKIQKELDDLDTEETEMRRRQKIAEQINTQEEPEIRQITKPQETKKPAPDKFDTPEYRKAFMAYVCRNTPIPVEFRADTNTLTTDIGTVIPPVTLNKIIEKLRAYGMILPRVTQTNYLQGVNIPTSDLKPTATWVAEGSGSDKQKKTTGAIVFSHYKLRVAVSASLESEYMAYSAFEAAIVQNITEAMAVAIEQAIISGTGSGQPTGILKDTSDGTTITANALSYEKLIEAEGDLPLAYENGAVWVMSKKTFMQFVGLVDTAGQPIARVNAGINGVPERTLLGRTVVLTDYVPSFSSSLTAGDVFAFLYRMQDYALNTNFSIGMTMYEDHDTDDIVRKSIIVCDGHPVDTNSLVKLAYATA